MALGPELKQDSVNSETRDCGLVCSRPSRRPAYGRALFPAGAAVRQQSGGAGVGLAQTTSVVNTRRTSSVIAATSGYRSEK